MQNHNDTQIKTSEDFFEKIFLSLDLKGLCVRGGWRLNKDCNILTSPAPPDIAACRSRSPELLKRGPGGPASLGNVLIPASSHQLVWSPSSSTSCLQLNYIIVQSPTQYLWNGMFDRHQAEIIVMQFTGHSLPVHQSMIVPWDFTLSHIVSQTRPRQWNMYFRRLRNGMFGGAEGQYTTL